MQNDGLKISRYVLLEHDYPQLHWDFMLEVGAVLKTWRLAQLPNESDNVIEATPLGDHRLAYLDYEGPVSGGRGRVRRIDAGVYSLIEGTPGDSRLVLSLHGQYLQAACVLESLSGESWQWRCHNPLT